MNTTFRELQIGERFYFTQMWRKLQGSRQRWVKINRTECQQDVALRRPGASITVEQRRTVWKAGPPAP